MRQIYRRCRRRLRVGRVESVRRRTAQPQLLRVRNSLVVLPNRPRTWNISTAPDSQGFDLSFTTDFKHRFLLIQSLSKGFTASLPHDYIYAILGLCGPDALHPKLAPDYSKPIPEIYR